MTTEDLWRRAATTRERACDCARLLAALKVGDRVTKAGREGVGVVTAVWTVQYATRYPAGTVLATVRFPERRHRIGGDGFHAVTQRASALTLAGESA